MSAPLDTSTWRAVVAYELALRALRRSRKRLRVVDLFAGAGGASWGATLAGLDVVGAINHDAAMLEAHARAMPWTSHVCEDLERLNVMAIPKHDVLLCSTECTGHTRARGKERKHHDASRATAWCPVRVADYHRPLAAIAENVVDLLKWEMLPAWRLAWKCLGYREQVVILNSADFGVPQARERVFFVFTDERRVKRAPDLSTPPKLPHVPVRSVLDLDTSHGAWHPWAGLVPDTTARIRAEIARGNTTGMVAYHGSEKAGRSLDKPCGTLDRNDRYRVFVGGVSRLLRVSEMLAIGGFPPDYPVPGTHKGATKAIGASVVPACEQWLCERVTEVL